LAGLTHLTTVILAGGLGSRLRSVMADRPKVLAEIKGRPFLAYLLDMVAHFGISDVVLCTGYLGEHIVEAFGTRYRGLHLTYSRESKPLGTAGAVRLALPLIKSDTILVMNGDSYCHADLTAFWNWHRAKKAEASMLLTRVLKTERYGTVKVDEDSRVVGFEEKGDHAGPGWINAGIYLITRSLLQAIPENRKMSLEQEIFPVWIVSGIYGYQLECRFLDIGIPEDYAKAEQFITACQSLGDHCGSP